MKNATKRTSGNFSNTKGYDSKEKLRAKTKKHNKTHIDYECGILKIEKLKSKPRKLSVQAQLENSTAKQPLKDGGGSRRHQNNGSIMALQQPENRCLKNSVRLYPGVNHD